MTGYGSGGFKPVKGDFDFQAWLYPSHPSGGYLSNGFYGVHRDALDLKARPILEAGDAAEKVFRAWINKPVQYVNVDQRLERLAAFLVAPEQRHPAKITLWLYGSADNPGRVVEDLTTGRVWLYAEEYLRRASSLFHEGEAWLGWPDGDNGRDPLLYSDAGEHPRFFFSALRIASGDRRDGEVFDPVPHAIPQETALARLDRLAEREQSSTKEEES